MPIHAFVFDLDGVVTDTAEYHYRAWKRLADEKGIPFTRADNEALRGVSRRESLRRLLNGRDLTEAQAQDWMARKNSYYRGYLPGLTPADILPGVTGFLDEAHSVGLQLAIASASRNARFALNRLELTQRFDVIGDGHSVREPKPSPDLFIWVADQLGVAPESAVVFEDAEAGVDAAKLEGCYTVGMGNAQVGHADIHLPGGLKGARVERILTRLEAVRSNRERLARARSSATCFRVPRRSSCP